MVTQGGNDFEMDLEIDVNGTNDAPTGAPITLRNLPREAYDDFEISQFGFMDADEGDELAEIVIVLSTGAAGRLTVMRGGSEVDVSDMGDKISRDEIDSLKYTTNFPASYPDGTFSFRVNDGEEDSGGNAYVAFLEFV